MQALLDWVFSVPAAARWGITLVFAGLVVALSVTPGIARPGDNAFVWIVVNTPAPLQKLMHTVVYAALTLLWIWTLESIESRVLRISLTLLATVGFGALLAVAAGSKMSRPIDSPALIPSSIGSATRIEIFT